jgi:hypothetical protein
MNFRIGEQSLKTVQKASQAIVLENLEAPEFLSEKKMGSNTGLILFFFQAFCYNSRDWHKGIRAHVKE